MDRLFFDTNVVLDVLEQRAPWFPDSAACLAMARKGSVAGAVSAISLSDISYIQRGSDPGKIRDVFSRLLDFLEIAGLDDAVVRKALARPLPDIEDSCQLEAAIDWRATHLVTRNLKDFAGDFPIRIMEPAGYLKSFGG